jgi:hypothetical protein
VEILALRERKTRSESRGRMNVDLKMLKSPRLEDFPGKSGVEMCGRHRPTHLAAAPLRFPWHRS